MKNIIGKLYHKFRELILYGIIGCASSSLDFLVYTVLVTNVGLFYIVANCISVVVGISTSFVLNRKYNFKVKDKAGKRFMIFLSVGLCGLLMSNLILYTCIEIMKVNELVSKVMSIVLVVFFQFILNKYITFKVKQ